MKPGTDARVVGRVQSVGAAGALVSAPRGGACAGCAAPCGPTPASSRQTVSIAAGAELSPGQAVVLEAPPGALAQISLSLYLLPSLGLVLAAWLAHRLAWGDGLQAVAALSGLVLGLGVARLWLARRFGAAAPVRAVSSNHHKG